jgi:hypothetical protein
MADRIVPLLVLIAGIAVLVVGEASRAGGATEEECQQFRRQCNPERSTGP